MIAAAGRLREPAARASLGLRLRTWWQRASLDRQLEAGANPATSAALARRATQLTTARFRTGLAVGLERVLDTAEEPPFTLSSSAPLRRAEVLASRGELLSLARELRSERSVRAQGVALAQRLLTDVHGPLYGAACAAEVQRAVRESRDAL